MARPAKKAASPKKAAKTVKSPKEKKQRAKKDPNAPKRGKSGYMFWLADNRARLTKPGMAVTEVSKAAGVEWNNLKDKTKWEKLATADKARYEKEKAAYKGGSPKKTAAKKK
ncbi:unnamed protein product, partial [Mesorhabditis belari]|uniref:HMG box domain-containing protein n=1 Tax=Mesorhabditis belari TaxID=2138241 RepID=A0AAF3EGA9_9BILA